MRDSPIPMRQIRAIYTDQTIRVYQAYSDVIADAAISSGRLLSPRFKMTRMSWIKPSFLWMMYRAGWGKKDVNQKRILAIDIERRGFEWALQNSSVPELRLAERLVEGTKPSPVTIQWDPERDVLCNPLGHRSIQIGLRGEALRLYVAEWIKKITDITPLVQQIDHCLAAGDMKMASSLIPIEYEYSVSEDIQKRLGIVGPS